MPPKVQKVRTGPSCFHFISRFPGVTDSIGFGNASSNDSHGLSCSLARVFCVGTGVFRWARQKIRTDERLNFRPTDRIKTFALQIRTIPSHIAALSQQTNNCGSLPL